MTETPEFEIFVVTPPGLEHVAAAEMQALGYTGETIAGGVTLCGRWPDVWRLNLGLRSAVRVLARIASFRAMHLAQLDKRARKVPWAEHLAANRPVRVEAVCRASRIYHNGAATERVANAIAAAPGLSVDAEAETRVMVRIDDDLCTISLDTTGAPLHQRGHKMFVGKAPLRENLASAFLHECGYTGTEPVIDPMCGSGTFLIEAAEIALGLLPGRSRNFAFEELGGFDRDGFKTAKQQAPDIADGPHFYGYDRDDGAVRGAISNVERAGIADHVTISRQPISDLMPPEGAKGLVMINPPYGARIGNRKLLFALYGTLGQLLAERFAGWRVGLVTGDAGLAKSTGLKFETISPPIPHGGIKVRLYRTTHL